MFLHKTRGELFGWISNKSKLPRVLWACKHSETGANAHDAKGFSRAYKLLITKSKPPSIPLGRKDFDFGCGTCSACIPCATTVLCVAGVITVMSAST